MICHTDRIDMRLDSDGDVCDLIRAHDVEISYHNKSDSRPYCERFDNDFWL